MSGIKLRLGKIHLGIAGRDEQFGFTGALVVDPGKPCFHACMGGCVPSGLYVTISGLVNYYCSDCTNLNDVFWVPHHENLVNCGVSLPTILGSGYHLATFRQEFTEVPFCQNHLVIYVYVYWHFLIQQAGREIMVDLCEHLYEPTYQIRFKKLVYGLPFHCLEFNDFDLPTKIPQGQACWTANASCKVSSP